jgi:hypothetical protein
MKPITFHRLAAAFVVAGSIAAAEARQPNFLIVLTDDVAVRHMPYAPRTMDGIGAQ